jgi:hypothetical protein
MSYEYLSQLFDREMEQEEREELSLKFVREEELNFN